MNLNKKITLACLVIFVTSVTYGQSSGGLFVEPMITYESTNTSTEYPAPFSNSTGTVKGFGLGARLGFHFSEALFAALDARYAHPQFTDSSNNMNAESVVYNYGPVVGMQMPNIGIRVWGTYVLGGLLNPGESNGVDVKFEDPKGYRIGGGFHLANVSLNLEYQELKYNSATLEKIGPFTGGSDSDNINLTDKGFIGSVSFPLEL